MRGERQNTPTPDLQTSAIIHPFLLILLRSNSNANRNLIHVGTARPRLGFYNSERLFSDGRTTIAHFVF